MDDNNDNNNNNNNNNNNDNNNNIIAPRPAGGQGSSACGGGERPEVQMQEVARGHSGFACAAGQPCTAPPPQVSTVTSAGRRGGTI